MFDTKTVISWEGLLHQLGIQQQGFEIIAIEMDSLNRQSTLHLKSPVNLGEEIKLYYFERAPFALVKGVE